MKKALKIIGVILLISLAIASTVFYCISPEQAKDFASNVWKMLNTPLPIIGITTIAILYFAWRVFVVVKYGKKTIQEYKKECENVKREVAQEKLQIKLEREQFEKEKAQDRQERNNLKKDVAEMCMLFPNVKVKAFGEKIMKELEYGEQRINANPEEK